MGEKLEIVSGAYLSLTYSFEDEWDEERRSTNSLIQQGLMTPDQVTYPSQMTPLMFAVWKNSSVDIIEILLRDGADINARDNYGETPLSLAVENINNSAEIIEKLIEAGADPNDHDYNGDTVLYEATSSARYQFSPHLYSVVEALLNAGADPDSALPEGYTALMYVDEFEVAQLLISHGANINAKTTKGFSVLTMLLDHKSYFVLRAILDLPDRDPEEFCVYEEATETLIKTLIDAGIDVNVRDQWGRTSLMYAIQERQSPAVCELLLKAKVDINATDDKGWTALMYLANRDNPAEDETYTEPEANDANDENDENNGLAPNENSEWEKRKQKQRRESIQIAHLLVRYGARLDLKNHDGQRALSLIHGNNGLHKLLSRYGAHP